MMSHSLEYAAAYRKHFLAFGRTTSLHVHDRTSATMIALAGNMSTGAFNAIDYTVSNWKGYAQGGFVGGHGLPARWRITLNQNPQLYIDIAPDTDGKAYVNAFELGETVHPMHAYISQTWRWEALMLLMRVEIAAGRLFPDFDPLPTSAAEMSDSRWVKKTATPKYGDVTNIRCVPAVVGNNPILRLLGKTEVFVIPFAYEHWAQIVLGGVRGWISQSAVLFA